MIFVGHEKGFGDQVNGIVGERLTVYGCNGDRLS